MQKSIIWFCAVISTVSIIFSSVVLCLYAPSKNLTFDYMGVIVGVLSLLVTILIGWNIYAIIDFNRRKDDLETSIHEARNSIALVENARLRNNAVIEQALSDIYLELLTKSTYLKDYKYIEHTIASAVSLSAIEEFETITVLFDAFLQTFVKPDKVFLKRARIDDLLLMLHNIKHVERIRNWPDVVKVISKINVKD